MIVSGAAIARTRALSAGDSRAMRGVAVVTLALTLACSVVSAAAQQPDVRLAQTTVETQRITGTVKATTDNGIVVVGRDTGNTGPRMDICCRWRHADRGGRSNPHREGFAAG